jgi:hypoxanthine phosphoribosyltransferase
LARSVHKKHASAHQARSFLKQPGAPNIPIQAIGLSLYETNVLIVDEVDDTRTTLEYAVRELEKDVETARKGAGREEKTNFSVFVLHNKDKEKKGILPEDMINENRYVAAVTVPDVWICYPWEATDIDEHDDMARTHGVK